MVAALPRLPPRSLPARGSRTRPDLYAFTRFAGWRRPFQSLPPTDSPLGKCFACSRRPSNCSRTRVGIKLECRDEQQWLREMLGESELSRSRTCREAPRESALLFEPTCGRPFVYISQSRGCLEELKPALHALSTCAHTAGPS